MAANPRMPAGTSNWIRSAWACRRRMLRLGDGWFPNPTSPQDFSEGWQRVEALAQETGQDAEVKHRSVYTTLYINDDVAQAESELRAFVEGYYGAPYESMSGTQSLQAAPAGRCASWLQDFTDGGLDSADRTGPASWNGAPGTFCPWSMTPDPSSGPPLYLLRPPIAAGLDSHSLAHPMPGWTSRTSLTLAMGE